ncbi:Uncharacterized protein dnm_030110 [Desulfonema magnum]|uniref:Uncharacterized protein n=2 Tax=Desulfonema magnum TaxID=45655 RepID=A0A975GMP3_9BACT|nr:Uncharacterized protein dnm_030110 [Desulfonema magnum]
MYQAFITTEPDQAFYEDNIKCQTVSCKQCGKRIPYAELYEVNAFVCLCSKSRSFVYLCPNCFRRLEILSQRFGKYLRRGAMRKVIAENKHLCKGEKNKILLSSAR